MWQGNWYVSDVILLRTGQPYLYMLLLQPIKVLGSVSGRNYSFFFVAVVIIWSTLRFDMTQVWRPVGRQRMMFYWLTSQGTQVSRVQILTAVLGAELDRTHLLTLYSKLEYMAYFFPFAPVSIVTASLSDWGSVPSRAGLSSSPQHPHRLWGPPINGKVPGIFTRDKAASREASN